MDIPRLQLQLRSLDVSGHDRQMYPRTIPLRLFNLSNRALNLRGISCLHPDRNVPDRHGLTKISKIREMTDDSGNGRAKDKAKGKDKGRDTDNNNRGGPNFLALGIENRETEGGMAVRDLLGHGWRIRLETASVIQALAGQILEKNAV